MKNTTKPRESPSKRVEIYMKANAYKKVKEVVDRGAASSVPQFFFSAGMEKALKIAQEQKRAGWKP